MTYPVSRPQPLDDDVVTCRGCVAFSNCDRLSSVLLRPCQLSGMRWFGSGTLMSKDRQTNKQAGIRIRGAFVRSLVWL